MCLIGIVESFVPPFTLPLYQRKFIVKKNNNIQLRAFNISNWEHKPVSSIIRKPIPIINFDEFFLNIKNINRMYLSSTCDRLVVIYGHGNKGVLYIEQFQLNIIEYLLSQSNATITIEQPFDMDNPNHYLYCEPRPLFQSIYYNDINTDKINDEELNNDDEENYWDNYWDEGFGGELF